MTGYWRHLLPTLLAQRVAWALAASFGLAYAVGGMALLVAVAALGRDAMWVVLVYAGAGLVAGAVLVWTAGRLARAIEDPLLDAAELAERIGDGDFTTPARGLNRKGEAGSLAKALDRMRLNLAVRQSHVEKLAYVDAETGLPNRAAMQERIVRATTPVAASGAPATAAPLGAAGGDGPAVCLIYLVVDGARRLANPQPVGAAPSGFAWVVSAMGRRIAETRLSERDGVARISANGFALLLTDCRLDAAERMARQLARRMTAPLAHEGVTVQPLVRTGCVAWAHADAESFLQDAQRRARGQPA